MQLNGLELVWEDQSQSSALYALREGRVVGIAASIALAPDGYWDIFAPDKQPVQALHPSGPSLARMGSRSSAKSLVEKEIAADGTD